MKIDITEDRTIRLREVFNSVLFETKEGEKLTVCMRDGGFEIGVKDSVKSEGKEEHFTWYSIQGGNVEPMAGLERHDSKLPETGATPG